MAKSISQSAELSAPSKVILMGEYLAPLGGPAMTVAIAPRFQIGSEVSETSTPLSPLSPAGRLLASVTQSTDFFFDDPHRGTGGLGASSAQFALVWSALNSSRLPEDWPRLLESYWAFQNNTGLRPSGMDLASQWFGGFQLFERFQVERLKPPRFFTDLMIFSATSTRKIATHEHLKTLGPEAITPMRSHLEACVRSALQSAAANDAPGFGASMTRYADLLGLLEDPAAKRDREFFLNFPGVLGVKGSGALLSDLVLVLVAENLTSLSGVQIVEAAIKRGLKLVCLRVEPSAGIVPS